ncbi:MAG: Ribosomal large subunit pseudouridine synthase D [Candidatus Latescibacteria bacterium ADurb.Bin168]|nr:MAG: Ribosomal large subunit pseudouridine synthase D [Candidatus Latescibacteria bacterium ADurb.Bin168]
MCSSSDNPCCNSTQPACREVQVPRSADGIRLDRAIAALLPGISRSQASVAIRHGRVQLFSPNGLLVSHLKAGTPVAAGQTLRVEVSRKEPLSAEPERIDFDIRYEDDDLLVVNKPAGLVVHPAPGHSRGTLVNALAGYSVELSRVGGTFRPGIVHRLDKNTSGLLLVAKNDRAHAALATQLKNRTISREYVALVWGHPSPRSGRIEAAIGRDGAGGKTMSIYGRSSRPAATRYEEISSFSYTSLVRLHLETGRTHQIRVHLKAIGHPVVGDPEYGGREAAIRGIAPAHRPSARFLLTAIGRQALHARKLSFLHPTTGEALTVESDPPADFQRALSIASGAVPQAADLSYFFDKE